MKDIITEASNEGKLYMYTIPMLFETLKFHTESQFFCGMIVHQGPTTVQSCHHYACQSTERSGLVAKWVLESNDYELTKTFVWQSLLVR